MNNLTKEELFRNGRFKTKSNTYDVYTRNSFNSSKEAKAYMDSLDDTEAPAGCSDIMCFDNVASIISYETNTKAVITAAENLGMNIADARKLANIAVRGNQWAKANMANTVSAKNLLDDIVDDSSRELTKVFGTVGKDRLLEVVKRVSIGDKV